MKKTFTKLLMLLGVFLFLGAGNGYALESAHQVYLCGSFNSWSTNNENYRFVPINANEYILTVELDKATNPNQHKFKIYDGRYKGKIDGKQWINDGEVVVSSGNDWDGDEIYLGLDNKSYVTFHYYLDFSGHSGIKVDKIVPSSDYNNARWRIWGDFGGNNWSEISLSESSTNSNVYTGKFKSSKDSGSFGVALVKNSVGNNADAGNNQLYWFGCESTTLEHSSLTSLSNNSTIYMYLTDKNPTYKVEKGKEYTVIWDANSQRLSLLPDEMYLYGYLNNRCWAEDNYEVMKQNSTTPWIYSVDYVDISGRWSADDEANGLGTENYSTEDDNYVAVFDHTFDNVGNQGRKYSTDAATNVEIKDVNTTEGTTVMALLQDPNKTNNFKPAEGIYYVEFDFLNMTVKFVKRGKKTVQYTWFKGDSDLDNQTATKIQPAPGDASYQFVYGDSNPDRVQVGVGNDVEHRLACQVVYAVQYREPATPVSLNGERVAAYANGQYEEAVGDTEDNPDPNAHYTTIGGPEYGTNHLIQLNKAGDYRITASLIDDDETLHEDVKRLYETPSTTTLEVTVTPRNLVLASDATEIPFNEEGADTLNNLLVFTSNPTYGTDFTVEISPATTGWPEITAEVKDNATSLEEAYKEAFEGSDGNLIGQLIGNGSTDLGIGIKTRVDGFYIEIPTDAISVTPNGRTTVGNTIYYNYNLKVEFPCSGVYEVKVVPLNENNTINPTNSSVQVTVYPNLYAKFNNATGFNINGYMWENNSNVYTITLPTEENLASCVGYIPGTYFASSLTVKDMEPSGPADVRRHVKGSDIAYRTPLMNLTNASEVNVSVSKNGATNPENSYIFNIVKGNPNGNVSTGVDSVSTEEGEAIYYNLQGVRVDNPQHGIYVKVVNGQASKVVL